MDTDVLDQCSQPLGWLSIKGFGGWALLKVGAGARFDKPASWLLEGMVRAAPHPPPQIWRSSSRSVPIIKKLTLYCHSKRQPPGKDLTNIVGIYPNIVGFRLTLLTNILDTMHILVVKKHLFHQHYKLRACYMYLAFHVFTAIGLYPFKTRMLYNHSRAILLRRIWRDFVKISAESLYTCPLKYHQQCG